MARSEAGAPTVSFFQQFRALFLKNASLFLSRKSTVVVQLVIPILLLSLIGGLTILIDRALDEANQTGYVERYQPFDASNPFVLTELERPSWRSMFNSPPFFHVSFNSDDAIGNELGFLTFLGERFGVLGTIEQEVQPEIGMVPETHYPFFVEHANHTSVNSALFDVYALWKDLLNDSGLGPQPAPDDYWQITNQTIEWHAAREYEKLLPYGALLVDDLHLPVAVPGESLSPRDFHLNYTSMAATRYGGLRILGRDIRTSPRDPPPTALSAAPGASAPRAALIVRALTQALLPRMLSRAANPPVAGPQEGLSACAHAYQENDPLLPVSYLSTIFPETDRRINLQNIFHNAFLKSATHSVAPPGGEFAGTRPQPPPIQTYTQGMPERPFYQLDLASLSGLFTYGLLLSLLLPVFVNNIVHDKQERLLSLMRMSGLRMRVYWIVNYLFNYSLYCLVLLITVLVSVSFGMKMFTETSPVVYLTIYLLWGHALVCLSFLFSTLLTNSKTATMIGYLIVIIGVSSSNLLNLTVFLETSPPFLYFLYPPFAFYRSVYLMGLACIELRCMPTSTLTEFNEIWQIIICLTLQCFVMFGLTVYLDRVLPDQHGTRRDHPLFIVDTLLRPFGLGPYFSTEEPGAPTKSSTLGADASVNSSAEALLGGQADEDNDEEAFGGEDAPLLAGQPGASRQSASLFGISLPGGGAGAAGRPLTPRELRILAEASASRPFEDPDCRAERATALAAAGSPAGPGEFPILLAGVGKTYYPTPGLSMAGLRECFGLATSGDVPAAAGPKVAVADLFLAVPNGQCFGLLGPNGAGKTSLISVLTGLAPASQGAGHCFVAGFPLTSIDAVQRHIGVCPQFDIYYPDLTVEDHLLFFARLKCSASDISTVMTMQATQQSSPFHALAVSAAQSVELYPEHYGKRASELSGGMRRRLSLAIALLGDPRVVILDEPTGGLDPSTRREVWKTIRHISRNRVILLTTHSMEEAEALCGRVGVLSHGSLRAIGTPVHLKRRYASSYALTLSLVGAVDLARKSRSNMDLDSEVSPMAVLSDEEIRERVLLWVAGNFPTAVPLPEESLNRTLCFEVRACLPAPEPEGDASANGPPAASPTTGPDGEFVLSKAFHLLTQLSSLGPGGVSGDSPRDTALASVMGLVQDWNLSPASLEEVFMRIVRQEGHFRA